MAGSERILAPEPEDSIYYDDERLYIIDQTALPAETVTCELVTPEDVADAIKRLAVRGAMAIGVAGAYGVVLGAVWVQDAGVDEIRRAALDAARVVGETRPTARNLFWALERMELSLAEGAKDSPRELLDRLLQRADEIALDTVNTNMLLVEAGQSVVEEGARILTHCNSGPLAALRYGTAVGVIIEAHRLGKGVHAYVDETRPLLQGSRLTAWELGREGVPYTLVTDSVAGLVMREGLVDVVITGADRIAANGDSANKIGTYSLARLAQAHGIPFYIAAPGSTVDIHCESGGDIVIEERDADEVRTCGGREVAPADAPVFNPAFDVTPAECVSGIITERGVLRPPYEDSLGCFTAGAGE